MKDIKIPLKTLVIILLAVTALGFILVYTEPWEIPGRLRTNAEYSRQLSAASEAAVGYIRDKYGFEAAVIDDPRLEDINKAFISSDLFSEAKGEGMIYIELKLQGGGREFHAIVTNYTFRSPEYAVCDRFFVSDSFQYEQIKAAAAERLSEGLTGGDIRVIRLADGASQNLDVGYFDVYYDGSNIDEIMSRCSGSIEISFPAEDLPGENDLRSLSGTVDTGNIDIKLTGRDTDGRITKSIRISDVGRTQ